MLINFKWLFLGLLFLIFIQFLINLSVTQTNTLQKLLPGNFYSRNNLTSAFLEGKFRIKIGRLIMITNPPLTNVTMKPLAVTSNVSVTSQVASISRISSQLTSQNHSGHERGIDLAACPIIPPGLVGPISVDTNSNIFWKEIHDKYLDLQAGGRWWPKNCKSRNRIAVIIPYRNRELHLKVLLNNLHPFLQKQQLDYGIFVIEEALPTTFNRAMLFNIGYMEALKTYPYQCFVFHDVDLLPENDKNIYSCPRQPRHMSVAIDKFNYSLPYKDIFGGVSALTKEQMIRVNGFSNKFFGWGGEDDDMSDRILSRGYQISRYPDEIARYKMIKHGEEKGNQVNPDRSRLLFGNQARFNMDGINSLTGTYKVLIHEDKGLHTLIKVQVDEKAISMT